MGVGRAPAGRRQRSVGTPSWRDGSSSSWCYRPAPPSPGPTCRATSSRPAMSEGRSQSEPQARRARSPPLSIARYPRPKSPVGRRASLGSRHSDETMQQLPSEVPETLDLWTAIRDPKWFRQRHGDAGFSRAGHAAAAEPGTGATDSGAEVCSAATGAKATHMFRCVCHPCPFTVRPARET